VESGFSAAVSAAAVGFSVGVVDELTFAAALLTVAAY
jgi:hypothetical protein